MASKYPNLFSPLRIGNVTVKNRVVSGPMNTAYTSIDGTLTQRQAVYYLYGARARRRGHDDNRGRGTRLALRKGRQTPAPLQ